MKAAIMTRARRQETRGANRGKALLLAPLIAIPAGCIQLSAPTEPIEINLNINIRQEVVVRLQQDVRDLIQEHPGVF